MIALLVFTDGRLDLLERTLASAEEYLRGPITRRVLFVDGDATVPDPREHSAWLNDKDWHVIPWDERRGFAGSITAAWELIAAGFLVYPECRFVFHLEDDFTFNRPVDLAAMCAVLDQCPNLQQLALRRQPVNAQEIAAGGVVEMWPDKYRECWWHHSVDRAEVGPDTELLAWLEHRLFWTTNPSLYRRELCARGWPEQQRSEDAFARLLFADPDARVGYWGARDSGEWVHHTGTNRRVGTGY